MAAKSQWCNSLKITHTAQKDTDLTDQAKLKSFLLLFTHFLPLPPETLPKWKQDIKAANIFVIYTWPPSDTPLDLQSAMHWLLETEHSSMTNTCNPLWGLASRSHFQLTIYIKFSQKNHCMFDGKGSGFTSGLKKVPNRDKLKCMCDTVTLILYQSAQGHLCAGNTTAMLNTCCSCKIRWDLQRKDLTVGAACPHWELLCGTA